MSRRRRRPVSRPLCILLGFALALCFTHWLLPVLALGGGLILGGGIVLAAYSVRQPRSPRRAVRTVPRARQARPRGQAATGPAQPPPAAAGTAAAAGPPSTPQAALRATLAARAAQVSTAIPAPPRGPGSAP